MGKQDEQRDEVIRAVTDQFPGAVAATIVDSEAFGTLAYRVGERMDEYEIAAAAVLDEDDLRFARRADNPAAFLARKVSDLPERAAAAAVHKAGTSANAPGAAVELIAAVRGFTGAVERIGAEEAGAAAARLSPAQLAWTLDRLDDVRQSVGEVLAEMTPAVKAKGAKPAMWDETLADLGTVADGLYAAMAQIDPEGERTRIVSWP